MNGTLLRRSASMLLASSFFAVAACSAEFNGLLADDAGTDGAISLDAGRDAQSADGHVVDVRAEAAVDGASSDGRGDATHNASPDGYAARDATLDSSATRDATLDGNATRDAGLDGHAAHDGDGAGDTGSAPEHDANPEDTGPEANLDATIDAATDAVEGAPADTGMDGAEVGPPGTCTGGCNTFDNIGQTITRTVEPGPPPSMTGGTILDGTYVATAVVQYEGDSSSYSLSQTSMIAGNVAAWVSSVNGQPPGRYTTTFTTAGNEMPLTYCCPLQANLTITYTTDGTTLRHLDPSNPNRVLIFERR